MQDAERDEFLANSVVLIIAASVSIMFAFTAIVRRRIRDNKKINKFVVRNAVISEDI